MDLQASVGGTVAHFSGLPASWYVGEMVQLKGLEQVRQMDEPQEGNCSRTYITVLQKATIKSITFHAL